jgi:hypothetical protein
MSHDHHPAAASSNGNGSAAAPVQLLACPASLDARTMLVWCVPFSPRFAIQTLLSPSFITIILGSNLLGP